MPESALREYRSAQTAPADFDEFWASTIEMSRAKDFPVRVTAVDTGLSTVEVYDVTFAGFDGQEIKAWLRVPANATAPLPTLVQFIGYGGGRGRAIENLLWASAGYAHFQMDTRGQGSVWSVGDTPDDSASSPQAPGFMTRGILSRETYYYRRVIADAVRAVDAARTLDVVDESQIAILGGSQGGAVSIAVASLVPDLVGAIAYVPFLCDFPRALVITDNDPYREVGRYLAVHRDHTERVHETLAYFDCVNFASRAQVPIWMSAALMDSTCPPSTVFGAFNAYAGRKEITVWPWNGHEGGGIESDAASLHVLKSLFSN